MAFCPSCGTENSAEASFCRNCGKTIGSTAVQGLAPDPVTGMPASPVAASGSSSSAALVIGVVLVLVAGAAAAGYYFLAGPGSNQAEKTASAPPPAAIVQQAAPAPAPLPAPPVQAAIAEPPATPPADMAPSAQPAPPPAELAPPEMQPPQAPKPRRHKQQDSAFFAEGNPSLGGMPPGVAVDPNGGRWMRMHDDMYRCGYDAYCQERVRQTYCAGYWGRVPDCVRAPGYPPY
jgi:hypothetical protein